MVDSDGFSPTIEATIQKEVMIKSIFDATAFAPRSECGEWTEFLVICSQLANLGIAFAYLIIPLFLFKFYRMQKERSPRRDMLAAFILFIFLCGLTHIGQFLSFHWPAYRLFTLVDIITAAVSIMTAIFLPSVVKYVEGLPSIDECKKALDEKELAYAKLESNRYTLHELFKAEQAKTAKLTEKITELTYIIDNKVWTHEKKNQIAEMKQKIAEIKRTVLNETSGEHTPLETEIQ